MFVPLDFDSLFWFCFFASRVLSPGVSRPVERESLANQPWSVPVSLSRCGFLSRFHDPLSKRFQFFFFPGSVLSSIFVCFLINCWLSLVVSCTWGQLQPFTNNVAVQEHTNLMKGLPNKRVIHHSWHLASAWSQNSTMDWLKVKIKALCWPH